MWIKLNCLSGFSQSALTQSACQGHPVLSLIEGEFLPWLMLPQVENCLQNIFCVVLCIFNFLYNIKNDFFLYSYFLFWDFFACVCMSVCLCAKPLFFLHLLPDNVMHLNIIKFAEWCHGVDTWLNVMNTVLRATALMTVLPLICEMWRSKLDRERKYNIWIQFTQPVECGSAWSCGSWGPKCCIKWFCYWNHKV